MINIVFQDSNLDSTVVVKNNTFRDVVAFSEAVFLVFYNMIPVDVDGLVFDNCTRLLLSRGAALLKLSNVVVRNTINSSDMKFSISSQFVSPNQAVEIHNVTIEHTKMPTELITFSALKGSPVFRSITIEDLVYAILKLAQIILLLSAVKALVHSSSQVCTWKTALLLVSRFCSKYFRRIVSACGELYL